MELPSTSSHTAATEHSAHESYSAFTSDFEANSSQTHTSPVFAKQPRLKQKISRLPLRLFGIPNKRIGQSSEDVIMLVPEPSSSQHDTSMQTDSTANSLPSTSSSNRTRRRPEVTAWIREPARKRNASNRVRRSYRKALKDPAVRKHLVISVILGFLLISTIAMYLAFALASDTFQGQQFHVLIILFIIILAIVFCHSVARTCMLATRFARYGTTLHRVPSVVGPRGYAQPAEPIHVILARDEEIAEQDQTSPGQAKVTPPPPAYGLWRNSVRIDPNMIHWQRVEAAKARKANRSETPEPNTANRPPSYISENGVDYVIEAQPRSTVSHQKELTT